MDGGGSCVRARGTNRKKKEPHARRARDPRRRRHTCATAPVAYFFSFLLVFLCSGFRERFRFHFLYIYRSLALA